jgi:hypothetical protein
MSVIFVVFSTFVYNFFLKRKKKGKKKKKKKKKKLLCCGLSMLTSYCGLHIIRLFNMLNIVCC